VTATEASLAPEGTTTPSQLLLSRLTSMAPDELARVAFRWSGGTMSFGLLQERMLRLAAWLRQ